MSWFIRSLMAVSIAWSSVTVLAQGALEREHPRVSELQDKMTDYARDYLQTRLQGVPFMVTVKIEPIRRQVGSNYKAESEKLPYYDLNEEEVRDEWDDPSASLYVLQSRLQKAVVLLSLPRTLKIEEIQEIKDTLMTLLRLIPGRDEIKVEQRSWSLGVNFRDYVLLASLLLLASLSGLLLISRSWAKRLAQAIGEIKPKEKLEGDSSAMTSTSSGAMGQGLHGAAGPLNGGLNDLKFRDPLKTREFVHSRVLELIKNPDFPSLQAMIEMDRLAERLPRDFGALIMEFPIDKQKEIFSLSYKPSWLNAFAEPGELTGESLELLDRLCRIQYGSSRREWENLIIQVWRHGADRAKYLRTLERDEAFCILKAIPVSVAVPAARQAFPGAWAVLLDAGFEPEPLFTVRISELYRQSLVSKPLLDFNALERYRQEKDLLDYLVISTIVEEKDIYGALHKDSFLWQVRPPFYQVLEADTEALKKVFNRVTLDDWSLALFNVSRDYRQPIEKLLNSKQKFLFASKMKAIDQTNMDKKVIGYSRERIAKIFYNLTSGQVEDVDATEGQEATGVTNENADNAA